MSAGGNVKVIRRMLRHSSAAMTHDAYADLFDDDLDALANALNSARSAAQIRRLDSTVPRTIESSRSGLGLRPI